VTTRKMSSLTPNCAICGKKFGISLAEQRLYQRNGLHVPTECPQCRSDKEKQYVSGFCSDCGILLGPKTLVYCEDCFTSAQHELNKKVEECQARADESQSKLLSFGAQITELAESLRNKERLIDDLERRINYLNQCLEAGNNQMGR